MKIDKAIFEHLIVVKFNLKISTGDLIYDYYIGLFGILNFGNLLKNYKQTLLFL